MAGQPKLAPRITTRFDAETWDGLVRWGAARGLVTPSEILRAAGVEVLSRREDAASVRGWRAGREQALAEAREAMRGVMGQVADAIKGRRG